MLRAILARSLVKSEKSTVNPSKAWQTRITSTRRKLSTSCYSWNSQLNQVIFWTSCWLSVLAATSVHRWYRLLWIHYGQEPPRHNPAKCPRRGDYCEHPQCRWLLLRLAWLTDSSSAIGEWMHQYLFFILDENLSIRVEHHWFCRPLGFTPSSINWSDG